jgi:uroporphyrinogen decarboxylase
MRQAGRYLPEYRAVRENYSFLEICKTPALAAEVSLQPFHILGVDAIIVFSDILIVAEAMGLALDVPDSGPILTRLPPTEASVHELREFDPSIETRFVADAIAEIARAAGPTIPVLGFAAAPWTLACYMLEARARGDVTYTRSLLYSEPALMRRLLGKIARVTARYLKAQIAAGATAVQLFDTWAGELALREYQDFAGPAAALLIEELSAGPSPVILYARGASHLLGGLDSTGADVLSLDWRTDLAAARLALGPSVALQGNVDPALLLGPEYAIRAAVHDAVSKTRGVGHILNLGHGIHPSTPVENARAFVEAGKSALALFAGIHTSEAIH